MTAMRLVSFALVIAACHEPSHATPDDTDAAPPADAAPVGADPTQALHDLPAHCSPNNWCWELPTPNGNRFERVFSTSPSDIWIAGDRGLVLQWNGQAWTRHVLPTPVRGLSMNFSKLVGTGPNDVWVGNDGVIYHWDGAAWTLRYYVDPAEDQGFRGDIWIAPDRDEVWVGMDYSVLAHASNGGAFERVQTPIFTASGSPTEYGSFWGVSADDFWLTGRPGIIVHSDGHTFTQVPSGTLKTLVHLWGTSDHDIWTGGLDGALLHYDGTSWTPVDSGTTRTLVAFSPGTGTGTDLTWLAQNASNKVDVVHWDGTAIATHEEPTSWLFEDLAVIAGRWWLPTDGGVLVRDTPTAEVRPVIEPAQLAFEGAWGTGDRDMYFATADAFRHWDGMSMTVLQPAEGASSISGVALATGNELFGVGFDLTPDHQSYIADAWHFTTAWDKTELTTSPLAVHQYLTNVYAVAPGEAIAVGGGGLVYRFANGAWKPLASKVTADLHGAWGPTPDLVWIVGDGGTVLRWDRAAPDVLTQESSNTTANLTSIHGAAGVAWVGTTKIPMGLLTNSGSGWSAVDASFGGFVQTLWAVGPANVVLASGSELFRYDGTGFAPEPNDASNPVNTLFSAQSLWAAGQGMLLRKVP